MLNALAKLADFGVQFTGQASGGFYRLPKFCFELIDPRPRLGLFASQLILELNHARDACLKLRFQYLDVLLSETRRAQQTKSTAAVGLFCFGKASALVKESGESAVKDMMLQIGQIMTANVRQSDMAVRYELTTIALVLADTNTRGAFFVADKMRKALAAVRVPGTDREVTLTVGIAEAAIQHSFDPVDIVTEVINRAEAALEIAKAEGGNKAHSIAPNLQPVAVA